MRSFLLFSNELANIVRAVLEACLQVRDACVNDAADLLHVLFKMIDLVILLLVSGNYYEERISDFMMLWPDMVHVVR